MAKDKVVFLTGGSRRIGANMAKYFHKKGFKLILHFNNSLEEAESLEKYFLSKRKNSCTTIQADFSDQNSTNDAIRKILERTETLDVLINNASGFFLHLLKQLQKSNGLPFLIPTQLYLCS